jgi:predicted nucleotidyltransferase
MKKKSLNLSGKIDSLRLEAIETISDVSNSLNIPFFLIGATARDFILEHGYGFSTHRATLDIDFGVKVPNWEKYQILRKSLIKTENISESTIVHRLIFRKRLKIDLIPFGPISNRENSIRWPPNDDVVMNILGFE